MNGPNSIAKRAPDVGSLPVDIDGTGFTGIGGAATTGGWTTIVAPAGPGGVGAGAPGARAGGFRKGGGGGPGGVRGAGGAGAPWDSRAGPAARARLRAGSAAEPAQAPAGERTQRAHERDDEQRQRDWLGSPEPTTSRDHERGRLVHQRAVCGGGTGGDTSGAGGAGYDLVEG